MTRGGQRRSRGRHPNARGDTSGRTCCASSSGGLEAGRLELVQRGPGGHRRLVGEHAHQDGALVGIERHDFGQRRRVGLGRSGLFTSFIGGAARGLAGIWPIMGRRSAMASISFKTVLRRIPSRLWPALVALARWLAVKVMPAMIVLTPTVNSFGCWGLPAADQRIRSRRLSGLGLRSTGRLAAAARMSVKRRMKKPGTGPGFET